MDNIFTAGSIKKLNGIPNILVENEAMNLFQNYTNIYQFKKLYKDRYLYTSELCKETLKNSMYVKFSKDNLLQYGLVKYFLLIKYCNCNKDCECNSKSYVAIIKTLITESCKLNIYDQEKILRNYNIITQELNEFKIIQVKNLIHVCYYIKIVETNNCYIIDPINTIEKE